MPSQDRRRVKGRRSEGTHTGLPHAIFRSSPGAPAPAAALSKRALALLVDLAAQYNGRNNGDLSAAPKVLEPYGWRSQGTVADGLAELIALGFLQQTRQGGRNRCSLYALTWQPIDEGPHDVQPTAVASGLWRPEKADQRDQVFIRRWHKAQQRRKAA